MVDAKALDRAARDRQAGARTLRFVHVSPSWGHGGREMRAVQLMEMLGSGVQHDLVAADGRFDALEQASVEFGWEAVGERIGDGRLPRRLRSMTRLLRDRRPDLLLTYNWGSIEWLLAARLARVQAVVHHEDGFGPEETEHRLWRRNLARRVLLRSARKVVVPSQNLADIARREWRVGERLAYMPNGVDTRRFHPGARERYGDAADDDVVFVSVGVLRPEKNQAAAVEALARAGCRDRALLLLVGDGPDRDSIERRAIELGVEDRVRITGMVRDTAPFYRQADAFLLPSRTEQMPLSLLEAMATGLPAVATDVGDVARIVAKENARWIVPPNDVDRLARLLDVAADDEAARRSIGAANRRRVESEFDRDVCYGAYCRLYLELARR